MAAALRYRGLLILHASAVEIDGGAVLFAGERGAGKSATAGAFREQGYNLVTDDVAAMRVESGHQLVFPSFPQLKLWPDTAAFLGYRVESLPRINPALEKRARHLTSGFANAPLPLRRVYVLAQGACAEIETLRPQEAMVQLIQNSFGARRLQNVERSRHFLQCIAVARSVAVCRLKLPRLLPELDTAVRLVERDLVGAHKAKPRRAPGGARRSSDLSSAKR